MPGTRHEKLIDDLEKNIEGFRRNGFRKSLYEAAFKPTVNEIEDSEDCPKDGIDNFEIIYKEACEDKRSEVREMCYGVPDGYVINSKNKTVSVYEVEVGGKLSNEKLENYAHTWEWLDYYSWDFHLVLIDAYGNKTDWDLKNTYYRIKYPDADKTTRLAFQINNFHIGKDEVSNDVIELANFLKKKFAKDITGDVNETRT